MDFVEMRGAMDRALSGGENEILQDMWNQKRLESELAADFYKLLKDMFVGGRVAEDDIPSAYLVLTNYERSHG